MAFKLKKTQKILDLNCGTLVTYQCYSGWVVEWYCHHLYVVWKLPKAWVGSLGDIHDLNLYITWLCADDQWSNLIHPVFLRMCMHLHLKIKSSNFKRVFLWRVAFLLITAYLQNTEVNGKLVILLSQEPEACVHPKFQGLALSYVFLLMLLCFLQVWKSKSCSRLRHQNPTGV